ASPTYPILANSRGIISFAKIKPQLPSNHILTKNIGGRGPRRPVKTKRPEPLGPSPENTQLTASIDASHEAALDHGAALNVVIQVEFVRMRPHPHRIRLVLPL